jgi:hypothetical protein
VVKVFGLLNVGWVGLVIFFLLGDVVLLFVGHVVVVGKAVVVR